MFWIKNKGPIGGMVPPAGGPTAKPYEPIDPNEWERNRKIEEAPLRIEKVLKEIALQLKILNNKENR